MTTAGWSWPVSGGHARDGSARTRRLARRTGLLLGSLLSTTGVMAQAPAAGVTPPVLPDFAPAPVRPGSVLPPAPAESDDALDRLLGGRRIQVRRFELRGSRVFDQAEIDRLSAAYRDRPIGFVELQALRERISQAYVARGYLTSGVRLPDQVVIDGTVVFEAVEGRLDRVQIVNKGRFRPSYFERRLRASAEPVVRIDRIEQRLQRLQQDPRIDTLRASLRPGREPGLADLLVEVVERPAQQVTLQFDNHTAPSLGAEGLRLDYGHLNLRGLGDRFDAELRRSEGLQEAGLSYTWPLNPAETRLTVQLRASDGEIVDSAFEDLDIESRTRTLGARLVHPLTWRPGRHLELSAALELRRSESFLLGEGFSFSEGPVEGLSEVSALRLGADWLARDQRRVAGARLQFSFGLDAFGATVHPDDRPDGEFTALLVQGQWVRRWSRLNSRLILRGELQYSEDRLLGMEQYSLGGHASVRGYREHQAVRDRGAFGSAELRVSVWQAPAAAEFVDLALFADIGEARNSGERPATVRLDSVGLGLLGGLGGAWRYTLFWGARQTRVEVDRDEDLQDDGLHFALSYQWPHREDR